MRTRFPSFVVFLAVVACVLAGASGPALAQSVGSMAAWGNNFSRQLGDANFADRFASVATVLDGAGTPIRDVVAIAGGGGSTYAVKNNGTVWAWGANGRGQLGDGTFTNSASAVQVQFGQTVVVLSVAAGYRHALAIDSNGGVWAWGADAAGIGNDSEIPVQVAGLTQVVEVAAGALHSLARTRSGQVFAWGENGSFQLGYDTPSGVSDTPQQVILPGSIVSIAAGQGHSVAVTGAGVVYAWGDSVATPTRVTGLPVVTAVAAHGSHTIALTGGGAVFTWGNNDSGQLGNGTSDGGVSTDSWGNMPPAQVSGLGGVVAVAAGSRQTLALKIDGTVWEWGTYAVGNPVNNETISQKYVPVQKGGLGFVSAVAAGWDHSLALSSSAIPPLEPLVLSLPGETGYGTDGVDPDSGTLSTMFTFKVVFTKDATSTMGSVSVCIDGACQVMTRDLAAIDPHLSNGLLTDGEQYALTTTLPAGQHAYHFEASDGTNTARLPEIGELNGPNLISIDTSGVGAGVSGVPYSASLSISGNGSTPPYSWSATGLPPELAIDSGTGVISGASPVEGIYFVSVSVTDAAGQILTNEFWITINAFTTPPPAQAYKVVDLCPASGNGCTPVAMNRLGQVAGFWFTATGESHAFLYSGGAFIDIPTLQGANYTTATAINDLGEVVGYSQIGQNNSGGIRPYVFSNGTLYDLGAPGGSFAVDYAYDISNSSQIVGRTQSNAGQSTFVAVPSNGGWNRIYLGTGPSITTPVINNRDHVAGMRLSQAGQFDGGFIAAPINGTWVVTDFTARRISHVSAINDVGEVIGQTGDNFHAFLYDRNGVMADIVAIAGARESDALALNESGQVAGYYTTATGAQHAFVYSNGVVTDLHTLGGASSFAASINGSGLAVGYSTMAGSGCLGVSPFVADSSRVMKVMVSSSPGWQCLRTALAINDNGQIVGTGIINGAQHAFIASSFLDQSISFGAAPSLTYGGPSGSVSATATSGLDVSFSSQTPTICTISGSTVTPVGGGTCVVAADQPGDARAGYAPAPQVTQSITVARATQNITFISVASLTYLGLSGTPSVTADSGLPVSLSSLTPATCTTSRAIIVNPVAAGVCTIAANQAGNANYEPAPQVTQDIIVAQASQTISFGRQQPSLVFGGSPGTVNATATSGLPVSFESITPLACTVLGATVIPVGAGACVLLADQAGDANYAPAPQGALSLSVAQAPQVITFGPAPSLTFGGSPATVIATASSGLPVSFHDRDRGAVCSITGNVVTAVATGNCLIAANQPGDANYLPAPQADLNVIVAAGPPVAADDSFNVAQGAQLVVAAPGVLANDRLWGGLFLTAELVSQPQNGTVVLNADGSFTYTPNPGFMGADSFTYHAFDETIYGNTSTVSIFALTFSGVTQPGTTTVATLTTAPPLPSGFTLNGTFYDITTTAVFTPPITVCFPGTFSATDSIMHYENGAWVTLPNQVRLPQSGPPFTSICADTQSLSPFAVASLANPAPQATDDAYSVPQGGSLSIAAAGVLSNDAGAPGLSLSAVLVSGAAHGALALSGNGSFTYTPVAGYVGADSFTYQAFDGFSSSNVATVRITIVDRTPPTVTCGSGDGLWHATDVAIACTASDSGSGLANAGDASFSLATNVAAGTETAAAATGSRSVCDAAGNCTPVGPFGPLKVDKKGPAITVTTPASGASYTLNQSVTASFACSDGGSGVGSCAGTVANGAAIDTATTGTKTFTVSAADAVGNTATVTRTYTVTAVSSATCLKEPAHAILPPIAANGSSVFSQGLPVVARFRVCDASGQSIKTPGLVTGFQIVQTTVGGVATTVSQNVPSVLKPPVFMWDPLLKDWVFIIDTRTFVKKTTYNFRITLNDTSMINFQFGVK